MVPAWWSWTPTAMRTSARNQLIVHEHSVTCALTVIPRSLSTLSLSRTCLLSFRFVIVWANSSNLARRRKKNNDVSPSMKHPHLHYRTIFLLFPDSAVTYPPVYSCHDLDIRHVTSRKSNQRFVTVRFLLCILKIFGSLASWFEHYRHVQWY